MDPSCMKPFKDVLFNLAEKITADISELEEQNARTKMGHKKT